MRLPPTPEQRAIANQAMYHLREASELLEKLGGIQGFPTWDYITVKPSDEELRRYENIRAACHALCNMNYTEQLCFVTNEALGNMVRYVGDMLEPIVDGSEDI